LVSTALSTNSWTQLPFPSPDVVVLQLGGPNGKCTIFNIYNAGNHQNTIKAIATYLKDNIRRVRPGEDDHVIWLGDFNQHHPLWEEERNAHLLMNRYLKEAQPLIELLSDYNMAMALLKDHPTLEALATKNWTRPDNIFCTDHTADYITQCYTNPAL
ncbi:hypothetical protein PAXRUDRAFT_139690, partial [Paxillus rubicundulus Ve08.2h10]